MGLRNRCVHFRIRDVYFPDAQTLLMELYGNHLLQGKVIDISDSGMQEGAFIVVKVEGVKEIRQPVIVPVERILGIV